MLCDVELRNCHQSIMVQAERVKFLDAITNPCIVDPRNVPVVNFGHCENRGFGDKMLVEFERFAVYSVRVWYGREFDGHVFNPHAVANAKRSPEFIHKGSLSRTTTEGFYDTALNEAHDA